jgi:cell division initiation protein
LKPRAAEIAVAAMRKSTRASVLILSYQSRSITLRLTPVDIRKQEFKRAVRGYDKDEVDTFLDMVAEEFEALLRDKERLQEESVRVRTQLQDYQEIERTLKMALKNADASLHQTVETAKRQADSIVREAEVQSEKTLHETKIKLADLKNELLLVRAQKDSFARRLRHLLESQLELIGVLEMDDLGFGEPDAPVATTRPSAARVAPPAPNSGADTVARQGATKTVPAPDKTVPETFRPTALRAGEVTRRTNNTRGAASQFRPVAEADAALAVKEQPLNGEKKENRISDHLIT